MNPEAGGKLFEEVFDNVRKFAEANLKMQQEMFRHWTGMWPGLPGLPTPQSIWIDKARDFQKQWAGTVSDLAHKHRDVLNRQYQAALESLDEALRVTESTNPEDFRKRSEQLCRKTVDCLREMSESQMKAFQDTLNKWTELFTKTAT